MADRPAEFEDQAEQCVLCDVESVLESVLTEPLHEDYRDLLETARTRVRELAN